MVSGDIFKTKYVTWNNFNLPKQDADCAAYELLANITNQLDIHKGTMFSYIQSQKGSASYDENLENLQYDLLYGKRYAYKGTDKYPASNLVMGIDDVTINSVWKSDDNKLCIFYIRILIEELVGTSEDGTAGTYNVSNNRIAVFNVIQINL